MKSKVTKYQFIGKKIKEAREEMNWSQKKLADELGFESNTAISLIESGNRRISVDDLEKISDVLSKDIKYFLGKEEEKIDLRIALRSDKELDCEDEAKILDFYNFVKSKKSGK